MGLSQALSSALAGVNTTQQSLSVIAGNVANSNTPGYVEETANQVAVADQRPARRGGRSRRHQPRSQYAAAGPAVDRNLRQLVCRYELADLSAAAADLRYSRNIDVVRRDLQQFHHCFAGAVEQPRLRVAAERGDRRRASADAKSQLDDVDHPAVAHAGGAGHLDRRADRPTPPCSRSRRSTSSSRRQRRQCDGLARGSARPGHHPARRS